MRQRIPDPTSGRSLVDLNFWGRSKFGAIFVESGKFSDRRLVEIVGIRSIGIGETQSYRIHRNLAILLVTFLGW